MVPPIDPDAFVVDDVLRWVEEEEVNGGVPYRVLVALSPNSGHGTRSFRSLRWTCPQSAERGQDSSPRFVTLDILIISGKHS
jgi:hypothetical protein